MSSRPNVSRRPPRYNKGEGQPGCDNCGGTGWLLIDEPKDGKFARKPRRHWERCPCVPHGKPGKKTTGGDSSASVTLYGPPLGERVELPAGVERPRWRCECQHGPRPCPWVGCRYNTYLNVTTDGRGVTLLRGLQVAPEDVLPEESCALDLADGAARRVYDPPSDQPRPRYSEARSIIKGGMTLEEVAQVLRLTRERVRQIEVLALWKLGKRLTPEQQELFRDLLSERGKKLTVGDQWDLVD